MAGYLRTIMSIIFFLCCQLKISSGLFNLYNTEEDNTFDRHCLYKDSDGLFDTRSMLIPYCIRLETKEILNNEDKLCYGDEMTFQKLKITNTSISDLFKWNADIELVELYEKYLLLSNVINDDEVYCKCLSLSQFGRYCQYAFNDFDSSNDKQNLNSLLQNVYISTPGNAAIKPKHFTCYFGIPCKVNLLCLDWRQVCNGVVDCDNGEDELFDLCGQLEVNVCNPETEFRCKNGLCIATSAADTRSDCPDGSVKGYFNLPTSNPAPCDSHSDLECEEYNNAWKKFSCGNGESISYSDLTSRINQKSTLCANKRDFMYLKQLFSSKTENQCWKSMICLTGFNYLYSTIVCSNSTMETNIKTYCPNEFYFPENSVIYSFVFFLYDQTNWFNYSTGPTYICYNKIMCNKTISILPTRFKNDLTCFYVDQTIFSWKNFYDYLTYLFHGCFSNIQTSSLINNKMLFKCNLTDTLISVYRIKDTVKDCFFNEDENSNLDLCTLNSKDHFKCLTNHSECIQSLLVGNLLHDCSDRSDEYIPRASYELKLSFSKINVKKKNLDLFQLYRFEELCDGNINYYLFFNRTDETDETDCDYWPYACNVPRTQCNDRWNCKNGRDEMNCATVALTSSLQKLFKCSRSEHYCIQLINNNNDIKLTCLNINKTGDGIIDCIGGTDEQLTSGCVEQHPFDTKQRFSCMNSSKCIRPHQVCDGIINCPFEDDERVCPWLFKSNSSKFFCKNSPSYSIQRCYTNIVHNRNCQMGEHVWFCDLGYDMQPGTPVIINILEEYPQKTPNINSNALVVSERQLFSLTNSDSDEWLCHQGYPIQLNNKLYCLCPPSYYGDHCQYQRERLSVIISIELKYYINPITVFRLIIYLLNENNTVISHDEIVHNHQSNEYQHYIIYLIYERIQNLSLNQRSKSKYVRIDSYIITDTNVQYVSSWLFNVLFPFLPVNRLKVALTMENELFRTSNCKRKCGSHGKCMFYLNSKEKQYCWCQQGWYGDKCDIKLSLNLCNTTSCAPHSHCAILNIEKKQIKCVCPLGKFGKQCYIKYNSCFNVLCQNNGTCLPLDQRNFQYICMCQDGYSGKHCQEPSIYWYISIPHNITSLSVMPVILVISCKQAGYAIIQHRQIYKNISLPVNLKTDHRKRTRFAFIQMFLNSSKSFYYMILIQVLNRPTVNTSVISTNRCQNVSEIINETILFEYSYLKRLKSYHLICKDHRDLQCYFDEYRMCFCTHDRKSECYLFDHEHSNCDYCQNNGACIRRDPLETQWDFICLCPKCSFGDLCEFSTENYFITLDMLIGIEMRADNVLFAQQSVLIYITLAIIIIMFIFSLILNLISIMIFANKKLQQVGCDLYLLNLTIIGKLGVIFLTFRFIYMIMNQIYTIENPLFVDICCKILEYVVRLIPSLFDWLTVCISIERAYMVIKDVHFTRIIAAKTLKLSRWIISSILLFNILTTMHRPFYLILVDKLTLNGGTEGHPRCVLDFKSTSWNTYEKFINVFHLTLPIILNFVSVIVFIFQRTRVELTTTLRQNNVKYFVVTKQQLLKYKSIVISTAIIVLLKIPRFIIVFSLACIQHDWQRYMHLVGYLISILPYISILFIYVMPSPKYKDQLKIIIRNRFRMQKRTEVLDNETNLQKSN